MLTNLENMFREVRQSQKDRHTVILLLKSGSGGFLSKAVSRCWRWWRLSEVGSRK
jgi:hypothetical protein